MDDIARLSMSQEKADISPIPEIVRERSYSKNNDDCSISKSKCKRCTEKELKLTKYNEISKYVYSKKTPRNHSPKFREQNSKILSNNKSRVKCKEICTDQIHNDPCIGISSVKVSNNNSLFFKSEYNKNEEYMESNYELSDCQMSNIERMNTGDYFKSKRGSHTNEYQSNYTHHRFTCKRGSTSTLYNETESSKRKSKIRMNSKSTIKSDFSQIESNSDKKPKQKKETITRKLTNNNNPCDKKLVIMTCLGKLGQKSFYESNEDKIKRTVLQRKIIPRTEYMTRTYKDDCNYKNIKKQNYAAKMTSYGQPINNKCTKEHQILSQNQSPLNTKKSIKLNEEPKARKSIAKSKFA